MPQAGALSPGQSTTVNGVPLCDGQQGRPAHDATKWHPLLAYAANGSILCTYGHEHGMNPAQLDAVFGGLRVPGGQQISYPWATVSSTGMPENGPDYKHRSYKWMGAASLGCPRGSTAVTALRIEAHNDGNLGATARFHSYWFEAQLTDCSTREQGYVSMGGHMDFARLRVGPSSSQVVPVPGDPPAGCIVNGDGRTEGALNAVEQRNSVWYGTSIRPPGCDDLYGFTPFVTVQLNLGTDSWGPIDPNHPDALRFYADRGHHHGTTTGSDTFVVQLPRQLADVTGHINFTGFVDRHGVVVPSCAPLGRDCIPLQIRNAKAASYAVPRGFGYNGDVLGPDGSAGYYVQTPKLS